MYVKFYYCLGTSRHFSLTQEEKERKKKQDISFMSPRCSREKKGSPLRPAGYIYTADGVCLPTAVPLPQSLTGRIKLAPNFDYSRLPSKLSGSHLPFFLKKKKNEVETIREGIKCLLRAKAAIVHGRCRLVILSSVRRRRRRRRRSGSLFQPENQREFSVSQRKEEEKRANPEEEEEKIGRRSLVWV